MANPLSGHYATQETHISLINVTESSFLYESIAPLRELPNTALTLHAKFARNQGRANPGILQLGGTYLGNAGLLTLGPWAAKSLCS